MNMYFVSGEEVITLPINPEELTCTTDTDSQTENVVNLGEVNILKGQKLQEFTIESFCKRKDSRILWLKEHQQKSHPLRFVCKELGKNILVAIESIELTNKAGEEDWVYYSIDFKQWKDYTPRTFVLEEKSTNNATTQPKKKRSSEAKKKASNGIYTVKTGDCLYSIAKKLCGNGAKWTELYNLNKGVVGKNPNLIYSGQKLKIPEGWSK